MCEFCENLKENKVNMDLVNRNNNLVLLLENGVPIVGIVGVDQYGCIGTRNSTSINYCPICGRDLRSVRDAKN